MRRAHPRSQRARRAAWPLATAVMLGSWALPITEHVQADCRGGSCRDERSAEVLPPSTDLSRGAREVVLYLDAWAGHRAMALRYGPRHPDMIARVSLLAALASEVDGARAEGATIARDEVIGWLRASIVEVEARLSELGTRCGPQHLDLRGAEARRDALREALTHWSAGELYLPIVR
ncbi:MAG: hypothetical protein K1X94_08030 [Sandaracinaceae bacterium]|nr:hypothetical protein [Sandaracinaceae bacterium]